MLTLFLQMRFMFSAMVRTEVSVRISFKVVVGQAFL